MNSIRKAASLIVCTTHEQEMKILMLKRSNFGAFKELLVFPGGKVDEGDKLWKEQNSPPLIEYRIAAIRETFEESGLLLTTSDSIVSEEAIQSWRTKVIKDPTTFKAMMTDMSLKPRVRDMVHWSNWISPVQLEKSRFDTHFFLLSITEQEKNMSKVVADGRETTLASWLTPSTILNLFESNQIELMPPQYCQVLELSKIKLQDFKEIVLKRSLCSVEAILPVLVGRTEDGFGDILKLSEGSLLEVRKSKGRIKSITWSKL